MTYSSNSCKLAFVTFVMNLAVLVSRWLSLQNNWKLIKVFMDPITIFLLAFYLFYMNWANDSEEKCLVDVIQCIKKRTKYMVVAEIKE